MPQHKRTGQSKRDKARKQAELGELEPSLNPYFQPLVPRLPNNHANENWNESQRRKRHAIELTAKGIPEGTVSREVGVQHSTFEFWQRSDDHFAAAIAYAEVQAVNALPDNWSADDGEWHAHGSRPGFAGFRRRYFGMRSYYHHVQIIKAIEDAPAMSVTLILCPPEAGKTTVIGDYINYRIAMNPNIRITLVSEGQGHAEKILGRVQRRMTEPHLAPAYIKDFGPFEPVGPGKPWTGTHFTVDKADHDEADFTLEARGASSSIYGTRTDLLIFDDIQSRKNLNQTEKLLASIRQDFLSRPGREGRTIFVGTRVEVGDVYEALQEQGVVDRIVCLPATNPVDVVCERAKGDSCDLDHPKCCGLHWPDGAPVPHEQSLIPELWDAHSYAVRRKQVTEPVWLRSYQQRPQAAGNATFTADMINQAKAIRLVGVTEGDDKPPFVILGLDPALGGQNALIAAAAYADHLDILDLQVDQNLTRMEQIVMRVEEFVRLYKPKVLVVETNTLQKGLARDDRLRELAGLHSFNIAEHLTKGDKSDDVIGVSGMAGAFSRHEITMPWGDPYAQRRMSVLCDELGSWRPDIATRRLRQDTVMACWFVWKFWTETRAALMPSPSDPYAHAAMPWKRMSSRQLGLTRRSA